HADQEATIVGQPESIAFDLPVLIDTAQARLHAEKTRPVVPQGLEECPDGAQDLVLRLLVGGAEFFRPYETLAMKLARVVRYPFAGQLVDLRGDAPDQNLRRRRGNAAARTQGESGEEGTSAAQGLGQGGPLRRRPR